MYFECIKYLYTHSLYIYKNKSKKRSQPTVIPQETVIQTTQTPVIAHIYII